MKQLQVKGIITLYGGLNRNVYMLFCARIINRFGDFVQLLLALILTSRFGMNEALAGLYVTGSISLAMMGQFFGGFIADRFSRKKVLVVSQTLIVICYICCGFFLESGSLVVPILILLASPFRGATWPASHAMVSDVTSGADERARAYSLMYLGTNIGVTLGPLAASFMFSRNLFWLFLSAAILLGISTLIVCFFVPNIKAKRDYECPSETQLDLPYDGSVWKALVERSSLLIYMGLVLLLNFSYAQISYALPLQFVSYFGEAIGTPRYAGVLMANAITVLAMTPVLTWALRRKNRIGNMAIATLFYLVGFSIYALTDNFLIFLIATCIWTNGEILMATNGSVFASLYTPQTHRARFNAIVQVITGIGTSLGPALGGVILMKASYNFLWVITAVISFCLFGGFLFLKRWVEKEKEHISPNRRR